MIRLRPGRAPRDGSDDQVYEIKSSATLPAIAFEVVDETEQPVDVTGDTLTAHIASYDGTILATGPMTIVDAASGQVSFMLPSALPAGVHRMEVHRAPAGGGVYVYPQRGYIQIAVESALA